MKESVPKEFYSFLAPTASGRDVVFYQDDPARTVVAPHGGFSRSPFHSYVTGWAIASESEFLAQPYEPSESNVLGYMQALEAGVREAFGYSERISALCTKLEVIEQSLGDVLKRLDRVVSYPRPIWIPIESFSPEPFEISRPLTAVVSPFEDGFEAALFEAGIFASGETEALALDNLKSVILDTFETYGELGPERLGPGPLRTWNALQSMIRRSGS